MNDEVTILIADDDEAHVTLIRRSFHRAGLRNEIVHFRDGQEVLDFFFAAEPVNGNFVLLLDVRMPKVGGELVLEKLKADERYRLIPVIVIATTDDPREVRRFHELGCSTFITKPIDQEKFIDAVQQLGCLLRVVSIPSAGGAEG